MDSQEEAMELACRRAQAVPGRRYRVWRAGPGDWRVAVTYRRRRFGEPAAWLADLHQYMGSPLQQTGRVWRELDAAAGGRDALEQVARGYRWSQDAPSIARYPGGGR